VLALALLGVSLRVRDVMRIVKVLFALTLLGLVVSIVLLLVNGRGDFRDAAAAAGGDYDQVLSAARSAGFPGSADFDLGQTLLALPILTYVFVFAILTAYVGGELRGARSNAMKGMIGSLLLVLALLLLMFGLAGRTFGYDFLGSVTFLGNTGSEDYPFAGPPFFFYFVSTLTGSSFLVTVIGIAFVAAILAPIPGVFLALSRSIFAWSFDRAVPRGLSNVSRRTNSPIIANVVVFAVAAAYLAFYTYGPSYVLATYYSFSIGAFVTFIIVGIAAAAFPFRRRDLYDASPIRRSIAGFPVLGWVGLGTVAVSIYSAVVLLTNDTLGANQSEGIITLVVVWTLAVAIWPISYLVNRRRGLNLLLADRELPPE
jgi:amino acid transporter